MKRYLILCQIIIQIVFKLPFAYIVATILNEDQPELIKQLDVGFALVNYFISYQYLRIKVLTGDVTEQNIDFLSVFKASFTIFVFQIILGIIIELTFPFIINIFS